MEPTIGCIVHFYPGPHNSALCRNGNGPNDPIAALIVRVWSSSTINLRLLSDGRPTDEEWVTSVQHEDDAPEGAMYWNWPARV